MGHNGHPNSLANLQKWQPGHSGNARGRPAIGASYLDWLNILDTHNDEGKAKYDDAALEAIKNNEKLCRSKRAAAADLLDLPTDQRGKAIERILDRTVGKPVQSVQVIDKPPLNYEETLAQFKESMRDVPADIKLFICQDMSEAEFRTLGYHRLSTLKPRACQWVVKMKQLLSYGFTRI